MKIIDHFGDEQEESSAVVFLAVLSSVLEGCLHVVVHSMAVGLLVEHWEILLKCEIIGLFLNVQLKNN